MSKHTTQPKRYVTVPGGYKKVGPRKGNRNEHRKRSMPSAERTAGRMARYIRRHMRPKEAM